MKSCTYVFILLLAIVLPIGNLLCIDFEEDFTWFETKSDTHIYITEDPDRLTIEQALDKRNGYQEIASKIEGYGAFEGVEYFGTDDRLRKIKTIYYFDTANANMLVREEITEYGSLLKQKAEEIVINDGKKDGKRKFKSKSSEHPFLWSGTKILAAAGLLCVLIYGIKKLHDRSAQHTL